MCDDEMIDFLGKKRWFIKAVELTSYYNKTEEILKDDSRIERTERVHVYTDKSTRRCDRPFLSVSIYLRMNKKFAKNVNNI